MNLPIMHPTTDKGLLICARVPVAWYHILRHGPYGSSPTAAELACSFSLLSAGNPGVAGRTHPRSLLPPSSLSSQVMC